jgi:hypothetical protein
MSDEQIIKVKKEDVDFESEADEAVKEMEEISKEYVEKGDGFSESDKILNRINGKIAEAKGEDPVKEEKVKEESNDKDETEESAEEGEEKIKVLSQNIDDTHLLVIIEHNGEKVALMVDDIIGEQDIIIKPLKSEIQQIKGFAGATILGDGRAVFILDTANLI